jgi:hypothetical protein
MVRRWPVQSVGHRVVEPPLALLVADQVQLEVLGVEDAGHAAGLGEGRAHRLVRVQLEQEALAVLAGWGEGAGPVAHALVQLAVAAADGPADDAVERLELDPRARGVEVEVAALEVQRVGVEGEGTAAEDLVGGGVEVGVGGGDGQRVTVVKVGHHELGAAQLPQLAEVEA